MTYLYKNENNYMKLPTTALNTYNSFIRDATTFKALTNKS